MFGLHIVTNRFLREKIMPKLDNIEREVSETKDVIQSAVVLLGSLKTKLDEAIAANNDGDDGAALDALAASLDESQQALAAAVAANTPAAPTPEAPTA